MDRIRNSRRAVIIIGSAATAWCTRSRCDDGRVSYRNRWARTIKWKIEHEAGEALFAAFNPMDSDERVRFMPTDGIANTNIVWHGGKLLALEEGHAPFEMDPETLESIGAWTFDGKLVGPMTAHPKIDPETGEMIFFGYNATGVISADMSFHVVDRNGKLTRSETFSAPYAAMVHDFMVTRDHVIFPIMPLTGSMERAMRGAPVYAWEPRDGHADRHHAAQRHRRGHALVQGRSGVRVPSDECAHRRRHSRVRRLRVRRSAAVSRGRTVRRAIRRRRCRI